VLSGCGVGLQAQTYKEQGRSDSASTNLGDLAVRNLHIEAPATGSTHEAAAEAVLTGALVNRGEQADTLASVTTSGAGTVSLMQDGQAVPGIEIPAGGSAQGWTAVLQGLSAPLRSGGYVSVTLSFTSGGRTTLNVPVHIGDGDLDSREVNQEPYGEGG
jgi:copper(I)-binding protein